MPGRPDLRLLPAACVLWVLAAIGTAQGVRGAIAALGLLTALVLVAVLLTGRREALRLLAGHAALVGIGLCLLLPALARYQSARDLLEHAAAEHLVVTLTVRPVADAEAPRGAAAWNDGTVQFIADARRGEARLGRDRATLPTVVRVLVRGAAAEPVRDGTPGTLGTVHAGDSVRVTGTISVDSSLVVVRVGAVESLVPADGVRAGLRAHAREVTASLPSDEAALVRGMTSGDTTGMSQEAEDAMRTAGLSHLVAVSGANIALVLGAVLGPLLLLGVPRRVRIVAAAAVGAAYVALVGDQPSVVRAATMALPLLAARFAGVRASPIAALAATLAVWTTVSPQTASSIGFVLSALATGAILILAPPAARAIVELSRERLGEGTALVIAVPLVAQLACTPVLILLAPEISLWTVAANIVVAPLVAPATILGLLALVVGPAAPGLAHVLDTVAAGAAHLVLLVAHRAATLPGSHLAVPEGPTGMLLGVVAVLLLVAATAARHRTVVRWLAAAVLVALLAPLAARHLPVTLGEGDWTVAACAVGQGDAVVLRSPPRPGTERRVVLVDTGPDPAALRACLDTLRVGRIDLLVLTHPHADHIGGNAALTGHRRPARQWACPTAEGQRGTIGQVPVEAAARGRTLGLGELTVEVLWPVSVEQVREVAARETSSVEQAGANDCSVVIAATWAEGTRFVGLGDLEPEAQAELAALDPGRADIVKVAHHGSRRQDPALYARLAPRLALIEVGQDNSFGHPAAATTTMLDLLGTSVVRTDRDGTAVISPAPDDATVGSVRRVGPPR